MRFSEAAQVELALRLLHSRREPALAWRFLGDTLGVGVHGLIFADQGILRGLSGHHLLPDFFAGLDLDFIGGRTARLVNGRFWQLND